MPKTPSMKDTFKGKMTFDQLKKSNPKAAQQFVDDMSASQDDVGLAPEEKESPERFKFVFAGDDAMAIFHDQEPYVFYKSKKTRDKWVFADDMLEGGSHADEMERDRLEKLFSVG